MNGEFGRLQKSEMLRAVGSAPPARPARRGNWAASRKANFRSAQWGGSMKGAVKRKISPADGLIRQNQCLDSQPRSAVATNPSLAVESNASSIVITFADFPKTEKRVAAINADHGSI
jgi:hypothetical protein